MHPDASWWGRLDGLRWRSEVCGAWWCVRRVSRVCSGTAGMARLPSKGRRREGKGERQGADWSWEGSRLCEPANLPPLKHPQAGLRSCHRREQATRSRACEGVGARGGCKRLPALPVCYTWHPPGARSVRAAGLLGWTSSSLRSGVSCVGCRQSVKHWCQDCVESRLKPLSPYGLQQPVSSQGSDPCVEGHMHNMSCCSLANCDRQPPPTRCYGCTTFACLAQHQPALKHASAPHELLLLDQLVLPPPQDGLKLRCNVFTQGRLVVHHRLHCMCACVYMCVCVCVQMQARLACKTG